MACTERIHKFGIDEEGTSTATGYRAAASQRSLKCVLRLRPLHQSMYVIV